MKKYLICLVAFAMWSPVVHATADGSGGNQFYEMLFGTPDQENASRQNEDEHSVGSENCDAYGGVIGSVNSFFCHMEKDMGFTGPGSATKLFGTIKVHAEIALSSTTVNGVTYDYVGQVWVCDTSSLDCSLTANYSQAYYIAFSYDTISGINKGYAVSQPGIFNGQAGTAMQVTYDIGSATATKTISVESLFISGGDTFKMWAKGQKTTSGMQMAVAGYDGTSATGFRYAMSTSPSIGGTKYFNMYFESSGGTNSSGFYSTDAAGLAAPPTGNGFCVSADDAGSSLAVTSVASTNCSALSFLTFDDYALTASGAPSVQSFSQASIQNGWNGMAAHPSSL